jgi:hypothetical protein
MGLQVIWTDYARKIFDDKISTLITDARILTINLFHAYLLNELHENNKLQVATEKFSSWKTERDARFGLLILLEDIFIHIFYEQEKLGDKSIVSDGLIGMLKANQVHRGKNPIRIRAEQNAGILTRQIQLGMMGRNKGGMISMGIFNGDLLILPDTRQRIQDHFSQWESSVRLKNHLHNFINEIVLKSSRNKQFPELDYETIRSTKLFKAVRDGYIEVFGKRTLPKDIIRFWKDRLGFNSGASLALYDAVGKKSGKEESIDIYKVMKDAYEDLAEELGEQQKIEAILRIEPFLSMADYTFRYISRKDFKKIDDHKKELKILREELRSAGHEDKLQANHSDTHKRLKELRSVMVAPDLSLEDWIAEIIKYHKKIMDGRKNSVWLELQANGSIKHIQSASLAEDLSLDTFLQKRPWFHGYYVESIHSLRKILNS